jgi:aminoglycoside phosphotransferase family enzyme/predicted kinase
MPATGASALPSPLVASLLRPEAYPHPVERVELLETHISWVFLTGTLAYKLKKPVDFGFLDFSTAPRREHFCHEELRLNRRLSAGLYLDVVPLHGPPEQASFCGDGPVIDHAVRMCQFPQSALLPAVLRRGELGEGLVDRFADDLARFQAEAAVAPAGGPHGSAAAVREPVVANVAALEASPLLADQPASPERLERLRRWADTEWQRLQPRFEQRLRLGRVRECHGDLHLGNLLLQNDHIVAFDCLEFSDTLRWIDVISEMAFLVMDLQDHGQQRLGQRLLNRWLEQTGDWGAMELWRWYACYRALVRAKVAALGGNGALHRYLELAERLITPRPPLLAITTGVSGLGKSRHSLAIAERLGWIRLRSDVERKREFGLWGIPAVAERSGDPYAPAITEELFARRLPALAEQLIRAGFPVVVDATFLRRLDRQQMAALAARLGVPFLILEPQASEQVARERIRRRGRHGRDPSDANEAVLEQQLAMAEPLDSQERQQVLAIEADADPAVLASRVQTWCNSRCG